MPFLKPLEGRAALRRRNLKCAIPKIRETAESEPDSKTPTPASQCCRTAGNDDAPALERTDAEESGGVSDICGDEREATHHRC